MLFQEQQYSLLSEEAVFNKEYKNPVYIILSDAGTLIPKAIKAIYNDTFTHASISLDSSLSPLYSFGRQMETGKAGFVIDSPQGEFYSTHKALYSVYVTFVTNTAYRVIKNRLQYFIDNKDKFKYDMAGLFDILRGKESSDHHAAYFCSRFVMELINLGNDTGKDASLYRPQDIADLSMVTLVNKGIDLYMYNQSITEKNIRAIKKGTYKVSDIKEDTATHEILKENVASELQKDESSNKKVLPLSRFSRMTINESVRTVYGRAYPSLTKLTINKYTKGFVWLNDTNLVGYINTIEKNDGAEVWVSAFEIFGSYKGCGLSKQMLDVALKVCKVSNASVLKENKVAMKVFKSMGFKEYKESNGMVFLSIKNKYDEATLIESFILEDPYDIETLDTYMEAVIDTEYLFQLYDQIKNYDYGYKGHVNPENYDTYTGLSVSDFEKYKVGICWDYVRYQEAKLSSHYGRDKVHSFFIVIDGKQGCHTHTFSVVQIDKSYYYIEASWESMRGIYVSPRIDDIIRFVMDRHIEQYKAYRDQAYYVEYKDDSQPVGKSADWYMDWMLNKDLEEYKPVRRTTSINTIYEEVLDEVRYKKAKAYKKPALALKRKISANKKSNTLAGTSVDYDEFQPNEAPKTQAMKVPVPTISSKVKKRKL